jgi:Escherichia/Staphylococcus phage prohead protease
MSQKLERRFVRSGVELRASEDDDEDFYLQGYGATFGDESEDLGGFREMVVAGAFKRALSEGQDIRCLRNHDPNYVLGRTKNHTLFLREDAHGLQFRCTLDRDNPEHRATHSMVKRGDIDACSFAFQPVKQEWRDATDKSGKPYALRLLHDVNVQDVSAVTYPAYVSTSVQARCFPFGEVSEIRSALDAFSKKFSEPRRIFTVADALKVVAPLEQSERRRGAMKELQSLL